MNPTILLPPDEQYQEFLLQKYTGDTAYTYYKQCHQKVLTMRESKDLDTFLLTTLKHQWFNSPAEFVSIVLNEPNHSRWHEGYYYYDCTNPCRVLLEFNEYIVKCIFSDTYTEFKKDDPIVVGLRAFLNRQNIWMNLEY